MIKRAELVLFRGAAAWAVIGLAGGLAYREVTRAASFTGSTQLGLVHTHALALGTLVLLVVLTLERVFTLSADWRLGWFVGVWNAGLALTVGGLAVNGVLQVAGSAGADSAALAGIAGTGHILLAVGFALVLPVLAGRIRQVADVGEGTGLDAGTVRAGSDAGQA